MNVSEFIDVALGSPRGSALSLNDVSEIIAITEDLQEIQFEMSDGRIEFLGDENYLTVRLGDQDLKITEDAYLQAARDVGLSTKYAEKTPARLILPQLNYWFSHTHEQRKALVNSDTIVAFMRHKTQVFSTDLIINTLVETVKDYGWSTVSFDKFSHNIDETQFVVFNDEPYTITDEGDSVHVGFYFQSSLLAKKPTILALAFAVNVGGLWGAAVSDTAYMQLRRKTLGSETTPVTNLPEGMTEDMLNQNTVYTWLQSSINSLLTSTEVEWQKVNHLRNLQIGPHIGSIFSDLCTKHRLKSSLQRPIMEEFADYDGSTMYDMWKAISVATAHDSVKGSPANTRTLMSIAGELANHPEWCNGCHRLRNIEA